MNKFILNSKIFFLKTLNTLKEFGLYFNEKDNVYKLKKICLVTVFINLIFIYLTKSKLVFMANTLIFCMIPSILMYFKYRYVYIAIYCAIWLLLAGINKLLFYFRGSPLTKHDFLLIKEGLSLAEDFLRGNYVLYIIVFIILLILIVGFLLYKSKNLKQIEHKKQYIKVILCFNIAVLIFIKGLEFTKVLPLYVNINDNYSNNGFVYSFSKNLFSSSGMSRPFFYNKNKMIKIADNLEDKKPNGNGEKPNIIAIQLESFFDPTTVEGLKLSEDPIPYFRKLTKDYTSGILKVPTVGGGTARSEFEFLTGADLSYMSEGQIPHNTVLRQKKVNSIAYTLKNNGYSTHLLHNYLGNYYARDYVYRNLGFDTFTSAEFINNSIPNKNKISGNDYIFIDEITNLITKTDTRDFIFGITVQLHGNYEDDYNEFKNNIKAEGGFENHLSGKVNHYVNEIKEVDKVIEKIIESISLIDEPTMLILYSDHLPPISFKDTNISKDKRYKVPYVIWDNMNLNKQDEDLYLYQLTSKCLEMTDIKGDSLNQLHINLRKDSSYKDYKRLVQYDLLYGKNYLKDKSTDIDVNMSFGYKKLKIDDVQRYGDFYQIYGENFTEYTKIQLGNNIYDVYFENDKFVQIHVPKEVHNEYLYAKIHVGKDKTSVSKSNKFYIK